MNQAGIGIVVIVVNEEGIMTVGVGIVIVAMTGIGKGREMEIAPVAIIQGVIGGQGHAHENVLGIMIATGSFFIILSPFALDDSLYSLWKQNAVYSSKLSVSFQALRPLLAGHCCNQEEVESSVLQVNA